MGYYAESALDDFINRHINYTTPKKRLRKRHLMNNDNITTVIRGTTSFAKILPSQLTLNYGKDGKEWKLDLVLDEATVKEMKALGISDRVKRKDNYVDGQPFITLKQPETRRDGTLNDPIKIVDAKNAPWSETAELGNGTVVDVKLNVKDYGKAMKKGVYIRAVRVVKHVEYNREEFAPITEDDPLYADAMATPDFAKDFGLSNPDDLDDEIPM